MTVTNLCVCVSSECVVWTLWMCACAALWAKMSQKSVISVALFASKAEINVFFYCACFKRVWTLTNETLISGIEVVLLFTLLHYFCHFFISLWGISVCVYDQLWVWLCNFCQTTNKYFPRWRIGVHQMYTKRCAED